MHIGFFITSLVGGGAERVVLTLAEAMIARGHQVSLYVLTSRIDYVPHESIRVYQLSERRKVPSFMAGRFYRSAASRFQGLREDNEQQHGKHDAFLFNLPEDYVLGDLLSLPASYYVVHTAVQYALVEQAARSSLRAWRLKQKFRCLQDKHVIAVSEGVEKEINSLDWLAVRASCTIYNPFDVNAIRELAQQSADVPEGGFIVHIGRAARVKRHDLLFQALHELPGNTRLVLLSKDTDKLTGMAQSSGVANRVVLPGFQENPYAWISRADLLVLCSDYEGFGNVLVEALICGTRVVSTDCPYGPAEILTGDDSRWLVPVGDAVALATRIQDALESAPRDKPAEIISKVSLDSVIDQYLALFDSARRQGE